MWVERKEDNEEPEVNETDSVKEQEIDRGLVER